MSALHNEGCDNISSGQGCFVCFTTGIGAKWRLSCGKPIRGQKLLDFQMWFALENKVDLSPNHVSAVCILVEGLHARRE